MLFNYFKTSLRVLGKNKFFSFLNITSLSLGLFPCIILLLFLQYEFSFDRFHKNSNNIYRVAFDGHSKRGPYKTIHSSPKLAEAINTEFPDEVGVIRLFRGDQSPIFKYEDKLFKETNYLYADENLFSFFKIQLEKGNPETALKKPHSLVITKELATKYFGNEDPIGKFINIDIWINGGSEYPFGDHKPNPSGMDPAGDYMITGILKKMPPNTHLQFDCILSLSSIYWWDMWGLDLFGYNNTATYVKLEPNAPQKSFENNLNSIVDKYHAVPIEKSMDIKYSQFLADGKTLRYSLIPLTQLHFKGEGLRTRFEKLGIYKNIYYLSIISLIALLVGCINFINLSTARSSKRTKEIGIRKVSGSGKPQLIKQFLLESIMLSFISLLVACLLSAAFIPYFNSFLETHLVLSSLLFTWVLPALLLLTIIVGFIAGIYPSYILSTLKPVLIINGNFGNSGKGNSILRNALVLFQYGISIMFIMGTLIIQRQLTYMHNKDLGYDKEQVLILNGTRALVNPTSGRYIAFKQELSKVNGIKGVSGSSNIFGRQGIMRVHLRTIGSIRQEASVYSAGIAEDNIFKNFNLKITSDKTLKVQGVGYFLTERAVKELKLSNPVGEYLIRHWPNESNAWSADLDTIIVCGVIEDFHYNSAQNEIEPIALIVTNDWVKYRQMNSLYIKIAGNSMQKTISEIETIWHEIVPEVPFTYTFLDQEINKFYTEEQKLGKLFTLFGLLSIIISCLGILGLSAYLAQQKNKEISIRKILGASVIQIIGILIKNHAKLIMMAVLIFIPTAYLFSQKWLANYPYRITIDAPTILITIASIILITGISISWQLAKGALVNPLDTIKNE